MPPIITKEQYLHDPCGSLPTAYWKSVAFPVPEHIRVLHAREYDGSSGATAYFRLFHDLRNIATPASEGFALQTVNINTQKDLVARILSECYDTQYSVDFIGGLTKTKVFDIDLWVLVIEKSSTEPVALGIADFDAEMKEGSLEWIQVLPGKRGLGLGKLVVNELLTRLAPKADFATVSGQVDNQTHPELLYRSCGFTGDDIWYVVASK